MTAPVGGVRPCRSMGCDVQLSRGQGLPRYCPNHRQICRECHRYGGNHGKLCRWEQRRHRPPEKRYDVVSLDHIADAYRSERGRCLVRIAGYFRLPHDIAEDLYHEIALTVIRRRRWLRGGALAQYFTKAMEYGSLRVASRRGRVVGVGGGAELDLVERRGERVQHWLREVSG